MTIFAKVIKNLYLKGMIDETKLNEFVDEGKLTRKEYLEILGKEEFDE